jgi:hypothetical protein
VRCVLGGSDERTATASINQSINGRPNLFELGRGAFGNGSWTEAPSLFSGKEMDRSSTLGRVLVWYGLAGPR